jgi:purine-binding chemotaxis protein CheW
MTNGNTGVKLVIFQLGVDLFAADVLSVDRVLRYTPPNSVPDVPRWVEGVMEHRGEVIPVIDLRRRIELAEATITPETRILVLNTGNGRVGAIVDAVLEVAAVSSGGMSPPPPLFRGVAADVIRGVTKVRDQLVVVLDVDRVMANAERIVVEHGAEG